jgi:hypothetical protein
VWCHPEAIANVLGLSNVMDTGRCTVTFDVKSGFTMRNKKTGATTIFERDEDGLFSAPLGPEPNNKHGNQLTQNIEEQEVLIAL